MMSGLTYRCQMTTRKQSKRWAHIVRRDPSRLEEAMGWYLSRHGEAVEDCFVTGPISREDQQVGGLISYYDAMHTDLDVMLYGLESGLKSLRSAGAWEAAEQLEESVESARYVYKLYAGIKKCLEQKRFSLILLDSLNKSGSTLAVGLSNDHVESP